MWRAPGVGGQDGSGNRAVGPLCSGRLPSGGRTVGVSQSFMQLIGYVVLAAIILATGFGAL
jgi:hypothetical protein